MLRSRKPWVTKLKPEQQPEIVRDKKSGGRMLIPTPLLVASEIRRARKGQLISPVTIRQRLAARFNADLTCPLCTGIFLGIVAGAADEQLQAGQRPIAPYWRVVADDGKLNPKFPPGPNRQAQLLKAEGWAIGPLPRGSGLRVTGKAG